MNHTFIPGVVVEEFSVGSVINKHAVGRAEVQEYILFFITYNWGKQG